MMCAFDLNCRQILPQRERVVGWLDISSAGRSIGRSSHRKMIE